MNNNTFSIKFSSQSTDSTFDININNDIYVMLNEIYQKSLCVKEIDNSAAHEELLSCTPPWGSVLLELSFEIVDVKGIATPKDHFKNTDALIEIAIMQELTDEYGDLFTRLYELCDDAEHTVDILRCLNKNYVHKSVA